jgi:hypothetical protein
VGANFCKIAISTTAEKFVRKNNKILFSGVPRMSICKVTCEPRRHQDGDKNLAVGINFL